MDLLELIKSRRSIRSFSPTPVAKEMVRALLEAAMSAPSAHNRQPWHFVVIENRDLLDRIPEIHPYAKMVTEATLAILVVGDPSLEHAPGYFVLDCSAAVQNTLLAAHSIGLGAVWVGVYPRQERVVAFRQMFQVPEPLVPFALIPIGHPAQELPPGNRYDEQRIHWNQFRRRDS